MRFSSIVIALLAAAPLCADAVSFARRRTRQEHKERMQRRALRRVEEEAMNMSMPAMMQETGLTGSTGLTTAQAQSSKSGKMIHQAAFKGENMSMSMPAMAMIEETGTSSPSSGPTQSPTTAPPSNGPTQSPSFDALEMVGACPEEWVEGTDYERNALIGVTVSTSPIRKVVYKCKDDVHLSRHCGQHGPNKNGFELGWTLEGYCDVSMGPTSSPTFDVLNLVDPSGCPRDYSSTTEYHELQMASVTVSTAPERKMVYQCSGDIHIHKYCSQYGPTEFGGELGWVLKGPCTGTRAPSANPTASPTISASPSATPTTAAPTLA